jgi:CRISPR-associated protein Csb2
MLTVKWEYLTGKAIASHWDDLTRTRPEWPPHPDRVYQALVAAWGETGQDAAERDALRWLERQPPPQLSVPEAQPCSDRPVYVPVNDTEASSRTKKYNEAMLSLLPTQRGKTKRGFPALTVSGACALIWPDATPDTDTLIVLQRLCTNVTHVGHSSSLVRMWVADDAPKPTYLPADGRTGDERLRSPTPGRLETLIRAYADGGKDWERPPAAQWQKYARLSEDGIPPAESVFGDDWIVYRIVSGPRFGLEQTLALTDAFRKRLIAAAERMDEPSAKALLSGHAADGSALTTPHAAFVPLGFVGSEHADGHLLGLAVVLPRDLPYETRDACLSALAENENPESGAISLEFASIGSLTLVREDRDVPPVALTPTAWCKPSKHWATITPVSLDRMPSRRQGLDEGWAATQIAEACVRVGLPKPAQIAILPVSRLTGAPACRAFPPLLRRADQAPRWHVHAELVFPQSVRGPILLGAGRFRGYGLCRPQTEKESFQ